MIRLQRIKVVGAENGFVFSVEDGLNCTENVLIAHDATQLEAIIKKYASGLIDAAKNWEQHKRTGA